MLYFVFTVDGDWDEYFRPHGDRAPDARRIMPLIDREIDFASRNLGGRFIHFVHASPVAGDFFLGSGLISRWQRIERGGGSIGVHSHEEDPGKLDDSITSLSNGLKHAGFLPIAYRGGYMAFDAKSIPILEANGLKLDFSCDPGRHLVRNGRTVSDWRGASDNFYRMSREDHRKPGDSGVFEVPLGSAGKTKLYPEINSLLSIWAAAKALKRSAADKDVIVSVMAHTYDFARSGMVRKLKWTLWILKKYGRFINAEEALELIRRA